MNNNCPHAERIGELSAEVRNLRAELNLMRNLVGMNAESRIYKAGKKSGFMGALRFIDIAARIIGTAFICGVFVAAGQAVGAFEYFLKLIRL